MDVGVWNATRFCSCPSRRDIRMPKTKQAIKQRKYYFEVLVLDRVKRAARELSVAKYALEIKGPKLTPLTPNEKGKVIRAMALVEIEGLGLARKMEDNGRKRH